MDERDVRQAFRATFDGARPSAGAADRAFAAVAASGTGAYGLGRRLAGAAAVALAILVVATLLVMRGALVPRHAAVPASRPVATPAASPRAPGWLAGEANQPPPALVASQSDQVVLAGWPATGQLALTTDGGATWTALHAPAGQLLDLQFVDADTALVSSDAGLFRFQRSTMAWTRLSPRSDLARLDFSDRSSGYALTAAGDVVETRDGGRTLTLVDVGLHPVTWIQWVSGTHAWAAGPGGIAATSDGGATWAPQLSFPAEAVAPASVIWGQVGFRDGSNGFALFSLGTGTAALDFVLYHTMDGGATWTAESCTCHASPAGAGVAAGLPDPYSDLLVTAGSSATLVAHDPVHGTASLCASTDAGRDWSCVPVPYADGDAAVAARGQTRWLVGKDGLLATSPDAGATWTNHHP
jgi:photosystem II stability/assembly factor-like uncharacterized protein